MSYYIKINEDDFKDTRDNLSRYLTAVGTCLSNAKRMLNNQSDLVGKVTRDDETGEIIEVVSLYSPIYSRLDCNGKIVSEYDEDELEFISNSDNALIIFS